MLTGVGEDPNIIDYIARWNRKVTDLKSHQSYIRDLCYKHPGADVPAPGAECEAVCSNAN